jgi:multicomponent Na+:H+ antiporter subunit A
MTAAAIILSPFLAMPVARWLGGRGGRQARLLALVPAALTAYFAADFRRIASTGPFTITAPWAPGLNLALAFRLDGLGLFFAVLVAGVGTLIVLFSSRYLDGHAEAGGFYLWLFAFMGSMLGLVLADNVIALYVFWELTAFSSYMLIGFEHDQPEARRAALQALLVTVAGGLALLAAAILLTRIGGTPSLTALRQAGSLAGHPLYLGIVCLVLFAAFTKSAQFPFHFWLPNAMRAPTPVSAYLHSATMVKAGVYLIARLTPVLGGTTIWVASVVAVGAVTMIVGAVRSLVETDLKRVLAYATIGALGVMMLLFGIGTPEAAAAGIVYLLAHACYKGALFLVAGALEHETGTRDVTQLAGLRRAMPITAVAAALAAASMASVPLFLGYVGKEQFYETLSHADVGATWSLVLMTSAVAASAAIGAAGLVAGFAPFVGARVSFPRTHEAPASMWGSPLVLAAAGTILGIVPNLIAVPVALAAGAATQSDTAITLAPWHGLNLTVLLSAVTLAATFALFAVRGSLWRLAWPEGLTAERLYTGTLAALDAISRRTAPALQSASFRSYVLTIVATLVALTGSSLGAGRLLPGAGNWTRALFHEGVLAGLIGASAVSAALARSNMAAVLSLGAVGYGVALLYALLGAPDLAMTQFAVETLTVVIFVLVFAQLRGFGDLSSRLVKARDATIAVAAGVLVTALVLFISTSGTGSRLAPYFADAAPRLAHGRNVVNVILVDFRAFDTLGETTVLVTVAIGVSALLLIGRERRS